MNQPRKAGKFWGIWQSCYHFSHRTKLFLGETMVLRRFALPLLAAIATGIIGTTAIGSTVTPEYELSQTVDGPIQIELGVIDDAKGQTLEALVADWNRTTQSNAGVYTFFPRNESIGVSIQRLLNSDPWMYIEFELTNTTDVELFYGMTFRMDTQVTSGPTILDAFMDLELIDTDGNGFVQARNTSARFDVTDESGSGPVLNDLQTIAQSPGGGFQLYSGAGVHSVFDVSGAGPNSDNVPTTNGYDRLTFFLNMQLSPGDTFRFKSSACYAGTPDLCPSRDVIYRLNLLDRDRGGQQDDDVSVVPLPSAGLMLLGGLGLLLGFGRRVREF